MDALWAAVISSGLTLIGTIYTVNTSQRKTQAAVEATMKTEMAVMNTKLENLTKEVEKHNGFAERIPKVEQSVETLKDNVQTLQGFHMHA
jgi:hypothetical protein